MSRASCCDHPCPFNIARLNGDTGVYRWMRPIRFEGWQRPFGDESKISVPTVKELRYATATDKLWLIVGGINAIETPGAVSYRVVMADPETGNAILAVAGVWPAFFVPYSAVAAIGYSMGLLADGRAVVLSTDSEWTSGVASQPDIYVYVIAADGLSWTRFLVAAAGSLTNTSDKIQIAAGAETIAVAVNTSGGTVTTLYTPAGNVIWTSTLTGFAVAIGANGNVLQAPSTSFTAVTLSAADGTAANTLGGATTTAGYYPGQAAGDGYIMGDSAAAEVILTDGSLLPITTITGVSSPALAANSTAIAVAKFGAAQVAKYNAAGSLLWTENAATLVTAMAIGPNGDVYYAGSRARLTKDDVLNPC